MVGEDATGATLWRMSLKDFTPRNVPMQVNTAHEAFA